MRILTLKMARLGRLAQFLLAICVVSLGKYASSKGSLKFCSLAVLGIRLHILSKSYLAIICWCM
jgi:hypothetical protein